MPPPSRLFLIFLASFTDKQKKSMKNLLKIKEHQLITPEIINFIDNPLENVEMQGSVISPIKA